MGDVPTGPLDAGGRSTSVGADPARSNDATSSVSPTPLEPGAARNIPDRLGRYTIKRVLGEGGMGTVYLAEQENPRREVALKVIRAGYLAPELLRRFELESQVLGRLQHPGIAQIYEAGVFASPIRERGDAPPTPFFAMEFVRGVPLTEHADSRKLGTRERLELLAKVCDAVYHAHQKGVIHRDLKPGNILVTELDPPSGRGTQHSAPGTSAQPKILDFGVARATDSDIQQTTMQTDVGQLIGTVPYMSPEQVTGDPFELDTRSDVYALGVIAYELLAGRLPHDLRRKMIHEAARIIREEEPTRLSSINRTLRGDIETIVAKALEKEKTRRYQSAESLASDIRRYLKDEPIAARPASTWYQAAKFAKRNRGLVTGLAAAFVLLIAGVIGTSIGLGQAVRARDAEAAARKEADTQRDAAVAARTAEETQRKLAEEQRDRAVKAEAETSERAKELKLVSDFQAGMLAQIDPTEAGLRLAGDVNRRFAASLAGLAIPGEERESRARAFREEWSRVNATDAAMALIEETILKPAIVTLDTQFKDQPLVDARLRQVLADRCEELGLYERALPLQERALEIRRRELGDEHRETLLSISHAAILMRVTGRFAEAEALCREALEARRRVFGEDDSDTLVSLGNLVTLLNDLGRHAEALPLAEENVERTRRVHGDSHPGTAAALHALGGVLLNLNRLADAEARLREAYELRERALGPDDRSTMRSLLGLAGVLELRGRFAEAEGRYREAFERARRVLGENHPDTLSALNLVGVTLLKQRRPADAATALRAALDGRRATLGASHPDTLTTLENLGIALQDQGRFAEAEPCFREALEGTRRAYGNDSPRSLSTLANLGWALQQQGRYAEAEPLLRESLAASARAHGERHPDTLTVTHNLVGLLINLGRLEDAEGLAAVELESWRASLGEDHPSTLQSVDQTGVLRYRQGRMEDAEASFRAAAEGRRRTLGGDHPDTLVSLGNLSAVLTALKRFEEAEAVAVECLERRRRLFGADHHSVLTSLHNLAYLLEELGRIDEAETALREAAEGRRRRFGNDHPVTLTSTSNLGVLLSRRGMPGEAEPLLRAALEGRRRVFGERHRETLTSVTHLVTTLTKLERFAEAEEILLPAAAIAEADLPPSDPVRRALTSNGAGLYTAWDKAEPGKGHDLKAAEWRARFDAGAPEGQR